MQISLYVIITAVIIYAIILLIKNIPAVAMGILICVNWVIKVVKPIIIGFAFAYIMEPMVNFFERRYQKLKKNKLFHKIIAPRTWAVFTSVFVLVIAVAGLISLLIFTVTDQIRFANLNDVANLINYYYDNFKAFYQWLTEKLKDMNIQSQEFSTYFKNATTYIGNALKSFIDGTFSSINNISGYMTTFIFSFIIGIYFMIDGRMFITYLKKVFKALFSENANKKLGGMVHDLDVVFSGYIRGQLTDALVMMFLISTVLSITGVKFAIIIGVFAGIGNLIPYFGPIVAYISTSLVCLISGDIKTWIVSMIALFLIQAVDGNLIGPKLLSQSIKIHPLIVMISLIFGSALGGFLGMLFAVPIGAYIKLVFVRFIDRQLERREEGKKL
jgi:predicted PurR-regulated permease PerM